MGNDSVGAGDVRTHVMMSSVHMTMYARKRMRKLRKMSQKMSLPTSDQYSPSCAARRARRGVQWRARLGEEGSAACD